MYNPLPTVCAPQIAPTFGPGYYPYPSPVNIPGGVPSSSQQDPVTDLRPKPISLEENNDGSFRLTLGGKTFLLSEDQVEELGEDIKTYFRKEEAFYPPVETVPVENASLLVEDVSAWYVTDCGEHCVYVSVRNKDHTFGRSFSILPEDAELLVNDLMQAVKEAKSDEITW